MQFPTLRNTFVSLIGVLLGLGLLMVYSASITARPTEFEQVYLSRHLVFLGCGVTVGVMSALLPPRFWRMTAPWLYGLTVLLLVAVLIPGIGHRVNGAQRWLRYGSISMQPSEIAKFTLPLLVCWWLTRCRPDSEEGRRRFRSWLIQFAVVVPIGLVLGLVRRRTGPGDGRLSGRSGGHRIAAGPMADAEFPDLGRRKFCPSSRPCSYSDPISGNAFRDFWPPGAISISLPIRCDSPSQHSVWEDCTGLVWAAAGKS